MLKLGRFLVQAVVLSLDEDGNVVGEQATSMAVAFTGDQLAAYAAEVAGQIAELNAAQVPANGAGKKATVKGARGG